MNLRLEFADTVIFLDYPRRVALYGVIKRILLNYNAVRPDMGGNNKERLDLEFLKYVWSFNVKNRPRINEYLEARPDKKIYRFPSRSRTKEFLANLE